VLGALLKVAAQIREADSRLAAKITTAIRSLVCMFYPPNRSVLVGSLSCHLSRLLHSLSILSGENWDSLFRPKPRTILRIQDTTYHQPLIYSAAKLYFGIANHWSLSLLPAKHHQQLHPGLLNSN
jgi:hypothetical protein